MYRGRPEDAQKFYVSQLVNFRLGSSTFYMSGYYLNRFCPDIILPTTLLSVLGLCEIFTRLSKQPAFKTNIRPYTLTELVEVLNCRKPLRKISCAIVNHLRSIHATSVIRYRLVSSTCHARKKTATYRARRSDFPQI